MHKRRMSISVFKRNWSYLTFDELDNFQNGNLQNLIILHPHTVGLPVIYRLERIYWVVFSVNLHTWYSKSLTHSHQNSYHIISASLVQKSQQCAGLSHACSAGTASGRRHHIYAGGIKHL